MCCDIDQLKIEIRHSTSWYLKSTNEISEFATSVLTENLIWREKQLKVTSIVFWKNAKNFSENEKLLRNSDRRVKKRCVRLHKNWKRPIWLTWIVTLIRSRNKFSESFFSFLNDLGAKNFKKMSYYLSLLVFFWLGFSGKVTFGRLAWTNIQTSVSRGMYLI